MATLEYNEEYYKSIIRDYGYNSLSFGEINFSIGNISVEELRTRWLCHQEGDLFSNSFKETGSGMLATGFGLSGVPHIGTLAQILRSIQLQKEGLPVSMVLGDLDAYNNKNTSLARVTELVDQYREFIMNLGFDVCAGSILRSQKDSYSVLKRAYLLGRYMTDEMFLSAEEDIYAGKYQTVEDHSDVAMYYRRKLSLNLMMADFIDLYFSHNQNNLLVMLGIDEHRFVRMARKITENLSTQKSEQEFEGFEMRISGLYSPIIKGFNNHKKMSKSVPGSGITVNMSPDEIRGLILTGEGEYDCPENNVVFQMMTSLSCFDYSSISEARENCIKGNCIWEAYKKKIADEIIYLCSKWPE